MALGQVAVLSRLQTLIGSSAIHQPRLSSFITTVVSLLSSALHLLTALIVFSATYTTCKAFSVHSLHASDGRTLELILNHSISDPTAFLICALFPVLQYAYMTR